MASEEIWLDRVVAWRKSGLSAAEFCDGKSYNVASLRGWSSRLGRAGKIERSPLGRQRRRSAPRPSTVAFARVVTQAAGLEPSRCTAEADPTLVVAVGTTRIEIGRGFDPALLRSVVQALAAGAA